MSPSALRWLVLVLALVSVASFEIIHAAILHLQPSTNATRHQEKYHLNHHHHPRTPFGIPDKLLPVWDRSQHMGAQSKRIDTTRNRDGPKLTNSTTKFIILTTGDQLKLYPLVPNEARNNQGDQLEFVPTYGHYLIKPRKAGHEVVAAAAARADSSTLKLGGEKSLGKLLLALRADEDKEEDGDHPRGFRRGRMTNGQSILPTSGSWHDETDLESGNHFERNKIIRKEPWIVDVDYFFDTKFCQSAFFRNDLAPKDCLVIVWLDKNNKLVRYGTINLAENPIKTLSSHHDSSSSSSSTRNKVLWLRESPPIRVVDDDTTLNREQVQVFGMVVDRRRFKIHVAFSDGSKPYANRILSSKFTFPPINRPSLELDPPIAKPETTIFKFNECKKQQMDDAASLAGHQNSFENLSLDEENGDWLFYFDHYKGGRIFALNIVNKTRKAKIVVESGEDNQFSLEKQEEEENDDEDSFDVAGQALVRDIALGAWPEHDGAEMNIMMSNSTTTNRNATGMAMDSERRRLYWMDEGNEIHECDYAGYNDKLIGKLSPKPVIRSPHSMQVFRNTLYLSDPIKKSLIAYKLPTNEELGSPLDHETRGGNDNNNNNNTGSQALDDTIQSTHQVLIVETPTIYGFRLVDIENIGKTTNDDKSGLSIRSEGRALDKAEEEDLMNDDDDYLKEPESTTLLGNRRRQRQPYLEDGVFIKPVGPATTAARPDYSHLLLDRVSSRFQCGYDQAGSSKRAKSQNDRLFFFLVELGLFNVAFFALWLLFGYIRKGAKAKEVDRLIKDPIMISNKCQV